MTRRRYTPCPPLLRDEQGRPLCRWCKKPVAPPRRSWCSAECIHEYRIRSDGSYIRAQLFERDQGVCAACGQDTEALRKELQALRGAIFAAREAPARLEACMRAKERFAEVGRMGFKVGGTSPVGGIPCHETLWHADHVIPVHQGGGECGLEGLQTLCVPCHDRKTRGGR